MSSIGSLLRRGGYVFSVRTGRQLRRRLVVINEEKENQQQDCADDDAAIRNIENREPDPRYRDKIHDIAAENPVDQVSDTARDDQDAADGDELIGFETAESSI